jgi:ubiquinone/menaquinone biosynthesis C-methylase UbiE
MRRVKMGEWFQDSFQEDYLLVYKHRDRTNANKEIEKIIHLVGMKKEDYILDLCCGAGRHTVSLVEKGYHVVGVDLSLPLLAHAKRSSSHLERISFLRGDMRNLPFEEDHFSVVLNLFTSFGYFLEDEENMRVLEEIKRVLHLGGRFLLDYINIEKVKATLVPFSEREQEGSHILEQRYIDGRFLCKDILINDDREERSYKERVKIYTEKEMREMFQQVGLTIQNIYGDFNADVYHAGSDRMIFVGEAE